MIGWFSTGKGYDWWIEENTKENSLDELYEQLREIKLTRNVKKLKKYV